MTTNRFSAIVLVIAVAGLALATASFANAPKALQASDDFALRHPAGPAQPAADLSAYYRGSDYAERRSAARLAEFNLGTDFAQRHPELSSPVVSGSSLVVNYAGSEYAASDPEFSPRVNAIDTSDYFLRHPEFIAW